MRLIPSDPDIETILRRIESRELDLQPDFQRGEVWSAAKKRRLVDSILRKWHVPPIHVVETPSGTLEVLDGQQRLVAIRDFHQGQIRVDGHIEPKDHTIEALHNLTFHQLPPEPKNTFLRFGIRLFTITDYDVGEPAELFYRLNQPLLLTSPEQRNAFFGAVRDQVRSLVKTYEQSALDPEFIGFSNSRMSHDDVVSRVCFAFENGTIRTKITAGGLANRYRRAKPFDAAIQTRTSGALEALGAARPHVDASVRFNKATLFSWLWMLASAGEVAAAHPKGIGRLITAVELGRRKPIQDLPSLPRGDAPNRELLARLLLVYQDRATSRVGDVSSVLARDFVLWVCLYTYSSSFSLDPVIRDNQVAVTRVKRALGKLKTWSHSAEEEGERFEEVLDGALSEVQWGARS